MAQIMKFLQRNYLIPAVFIGLGLQYVQSLVGMYTLDEAVDYYAEVHRSEVNSIIHTMFMPLTMYGMFMWIPGALCLKWYHARKLRDFLLTVYMFHYLRISLLGGFSTVLLYIYPYIRSDIDYYHLGPKQSFFRGIVFSVGALMIQEIVGHYLGGDPPSRVEAIPNAILYAPYYSGSWFL